MKIKSLINIIKKPRKLIRHLGDRKLFNWMNDEAYLRLIFLCETGKKLNLENPVTYNEKLQWLKIHDRKPEYCAYVDKYEVRNYIKDIIGEQYLIPLIDVYNQISDILWNELPEKFVLKCTHGSGCNIICTDKNKLDINGSIIKLKKWMRKNWYWFGREWPYKNVKPRIICETFISDTDKVPNDYKILCFNGKAKLIEVHLDRYGRHTQDFYDIEWNKTTIVQGSPPSSIKCDRPKQLENMIKLSETLAQYMRHVRVDWYVAKNNLYFGEITLYDSSGFSTFSSEKDDYLLGSWIDIEER